MLIVAGLYSYHACFQLYPTLSICCRLWTKMLESRIATLSCVAHHIAAGNKADLEYKCIPLFPLVMIPIQFTIYGYCVDAWIFICSCPVDVIDVYPQFYAYTMQLYVCIAYQSFSQLPFMQYMGLCIFSLPTSLLMTVGVIVLHLIILMNSEIWIISHCFGLP